MARKRKVHQIIGGKIPVKRSGKGTISSVRVSFKAQKDAMDMGIFASRIPRYTRPAGGLLKAKPHNTAQDRSHENGLGKVIVLLERRHIRDLVQ